jgi:hypothetical protein
VLVDRSRENRKCDFGKGRWSARIQITPTVVGVGQSLGLLQIDADSVSPQRNVFDTPSVIITNRVLLPFEKTPRRSTPTPVAKTSKGSKDIGKEKKREGKGKEKGTRLIVWN